MRLHTDGRFEHKLSEWEEERAESLRTLSTDIEQWKLSGKNTLEPGELDRLVSAHSEHLHENSAFPREARSAQRAKVEASLQVRSTHPACRTLLAWGGVSLTTPPTASGHAHRSAQTRSERGVPPRPVRARFSAGTDGRHLQAAHEGRARQNARAAA